MKVTKDTFILDLLQEYPGAIQILEDYDLKCFKCLGANYESLESIAIVNNINLEQLLIKLNQLTKDN